MPIEVLCTPDAESQPVPVLTWCAPRGCARSAETEAREYAGEPPTSSFADNRAATADRRFSGHARACAGDVGRAPALGPTTSRQSSSLRMGKAIVTMAASEAAHLLGGKRLKR